MRLRRKTLLALVGVTLVGWLVAGVVASYFLVSRRGSDDTETLPVWAQGKDWFEDVRLHTADGEELGAWFVPARGEQATPGKAIRAVALFLHGYSARRTSMNAHAAKASQEGFHGMNLSFRAHGDSTGDWNDLGWSAKQDVLAAVEFIEQRAPGLPIVIVATSMGAAAAIFAAPELGDRVRAYWLNAPYHDLKSAAWDRCVRSFPPLLDSLAYAGLRLWTPLWLGTDIGGIRPIDHVGRMSSKATVVFTVGEFDEESPPEDVRALATGCAGESRLIVYPGVGHEGREARDFEGYLEEVLEFLDSVVE